MNTIFWPFLSNFFKCNCPGIDSNGAIILGAAKPGFRALATGWAAVNGEYPYLLEDDANPNNWEIGLVRVQGTVAYTFSGKKRLVIDSGSGTGFANGTTGLTLSQGPAAAMVMAGGLSELDGTAVAVARATSDNIAVGPGANADQQWTYGGTAVGLNATVLEVDGLAVGNLALASKECGVAIGAYSRSTFPGEIALGGDLNMPNLHFLPMKAWQDGAGTKALTAAAGGSAASVLNFAAWALVNRREGPARISGRMVLNAFVDYTLVAGMAGALVVDFDYMLWLNEASGGTCAVMGTPLFTAVYTGSSAPVVTFGVAASTGVVTFTTAGTGQVSARALARIDNLACG